MDLLSRIGFVVFALLTLVSAVWVVSLRNLFRAALSLGLTLIGVAGLFLLLGAEFLAFVQILVYVGAILTLIFFAIMLTSRPRGSGAPPAGARQQAPAALVSFALFGVLAVSTHAVAWPAQGAGGPVTLAALGQQLVTTLVLPFEVISLIFVAAAVGAVVLAMEHRAPQAPTK
jgi:NADH-quinone oxidoreductase subunit J